LWRATFTRSPYWRAQRKLRESVKLYRADLARAGGGTDGRGDPLKMRQGWPIVTGDLVQVTSTSRKRDVDNKGKWLKNADGTFVAQDWLGAQGKVLRVLRATRQVIVEGVNVRTRIAQVCTCTRFSWGGAHKCGRSRIRMLLAQHF
jgi:hypothetical protein